MSSLYWNEWTWTELRDQKPDVASLPIGSVEAHGPHLPLATDSIISEELARRAALELRSQRLVALILPPLHYAITDFSKDFPGTITVSKTTLQNTLDDIAQSLLRHRITSLCLVNSHLEPEHIAALEEFCRSQKDLVVLFPDKTKKPWASRLTDEFKQGACHAGSYETSLVLSTNKNLVRDNHTQLAANPTNLARLMKQGVKSFHEAGASLAYFGDPARASIEEGERTYSILVQMIVEAVLQSRKG